MKKAALKNFSILTGKHLRWSLFFVWELSNSRNLSTLIKLNTSKQVILSIVIILSLRDPVTYYAKAFFYKCFRNVENTCKM